jgi:DNA invertase Pin-like site-specific DNA recombinase
MLAQRTSKEGRQMLGTTCKLTILYERLSRDDDLAGESNSIANQKRLLEEYAERKSFVPYEHLTDDGYTGTNYNRPGWMELVARIERDEVACLIIKDSSRMGRDYLRTGLYREMFRERGVRLIAVNDGIDTFERDDDFTPFREIMSEWYARDTSRKIKSVLTAKGKDGKPLTNVVPYGYKKDPNDKHKWLIDDEVAAVVRRMFKLTLDGYGPYAIAKMLSNDKVLKPSAYFDENEITNGSMFPFANDDPYAWRGGVVAAYLAKPEYAGHTVNFRSGRQNFKDEKREYFSPDNWLIFENTHPAIVEQHTWDAVQRARQTVRRGEPMGAPNPLTGILFCGKCGAKMYNNRSRNLKPIKKPNGKLYQPPPRDAYSCSTYLNARHVRHNECESNAIQTHIVRKIILDIIRDTSRYALENEQEFLRKLRELSVVQQNETAKSHRRKIAKNEKRLADLRTLFKKTYEDNAIGKLPDDLFAELAADYEKERAELTEQNAKMQAELSEFAEDSENAEKFLQLSRRYTEFNELTAQILNEFVDHVVVYPTDKTNPERTREIEVHLNYINKFDVPEKSAPELSEAERKLLDAQQHKREKSREYYLRKKVEAASASAT